MSAEATTKRKIYEEPEELEKTGQVSTILAAHMVLLQTRLALDKILTRSGSALIRRS